MPLILNQYRQSSTYKDVVGQRYHFPDRYLKPFGTLPSPFIYYEPRDGGEQIYFGAGVITAIAPDPEETGHSYATVKAYWQFSTPVNFYEGPNGQTWELASKMRNSVRNINAPLFDLITAAGGLNPEDVRAGAP